MPKGNPGSLSESELIEREESRKLIRDMYDVYESDESAFRVMHKRENITGRFWLAIRHVWSNLEVKERQVVSTAQLIADAVSNSSEPVSDVTLFIEHRVSTADIRRYLSHEIDAPCVPMEKKDGRDTLFAVACDDTGYDAVVDDKGETTYVGKGEFDGFRGVKIRKRSPNKSKEQ